MRRAALAMGVLVVGAVAFAAGDAPSLPTQKNKDNKRPPDLERGRELFLRHCVACHGGALDGAGPAAADLVAPVPDLRGKVLEDDREKWVGLLLSGKDAMPGFESSFDKHDARRLLKFIAQLDSGDLDDRYALDRDDKKKKRKAEAAEDDAEDAVDDEGAEGNAPAEDEDED